MLNARAHCQKLFELKIKSARLDELNILLNMDQKDNELVDSEPEESETEIKHISNRER